MSSYILTFEYRDEKTDTQKLLGALLKLFAVNMPKIFKFLNHKKIKLTYTQKGKLNVR